MRKTILLSALLGATLTALPAAAQPGYDNGRHDNGRYDRGYDRGGERGWGNGQYRDGARQELWQLSQRVDRGVQRGDLTRREADYFHREIAQLRYLDQRFGDRGYDGRERAELDRRIDRLRDRLRFERRDDDRRHARW